MLLFQAMQPRSPVPLDQPVIGIPLPRIVPAGRCIGKDADEIVVCGSRGGDERYRLRPLPRGYDPKGINAETGLVDGVAGSIHADAVELAPGMTSKRILVTIKTKC
jgi:hypothetical protein